MNGSGVDMFLGKEMPNIIDLISAKQNDIQAMNSQMRHALREALVNSEVTLQDSHNAPTIENTLTHSTPTIENTLTDDPPPFENISDEVHSTESPGSPDCGPQSTIRPQPSENNEEMVLISDTNTEHHISAHSDHKEQCRVPVDARVDANPSPSQLDPNYHLLDSKMVVILDQMANMMTRMENIESNQKSVSVTPVIENNVKEDIASIKRRLQRIESDHKNVSASPVGVNNVKEDINIIKRRLSQVERQSLQEQTVPKAVSCDNNNNTCPGTNSVQSLHIFEDKMTAVVSAVTACGKEIAKLGNELHGALSSTTTSINSSMSHLTDTIV